MSDTLPGGPSAPVIKPRKKSWPALVWLVPIIAALIGAWLVWRDYQNQGPSITVTFASGAGVEAEKTRVKYRDVDVGLVTNVHLLPDLTGVELTIQLDPESKPYLNNATRFWIVRPRVGLTDISGLDTLVSGVFVEIDPATEGEPTLTFTGLDNPPAVRNGDPGTQFTLVTDHIGSVSQGAPVLHRGIRVGEILGYEMDPATGEISVPIFVRAPYDKMVRLDSRFWDASGVSVDFGANGVELQLASLQALLAGGVNFTTPLGTLQVTYPAPPDSTFNLFRTEEEVEETRFTRRQNFILFFEGSVRGLERGASVEFHGIKVGEVLDVRLEFDAEALNFRIPVLIAIEPDRVTTRQNVSDAHRRKVENEADAEREMRRMVHLGLRARLKTANLISGAQFVDLGFYPETLPNYRAYDEETLTEIPTLPQQFEEIARSLQGMVNMVESLPLADIAKSMIGALNSVEQAAAMPELPEALIRITKAAEGVEGLMGRIDGETLPYIANTLAEAETALRSVQGLVEEGSRERVNLDKTLDELALASRSARLLAAYLERNPNALLVGK